jgi:hypothetical protein
VKEGNFNNVLESSSRKPSRAYNLVVCDEAHNIFKDEELSISLRPFLSADVSQMIFLSDISQSNGQERYYPQERNMHIVVLEEVVRCTERLMTGAKVYQLLEGETNNTRCVHGVVGPPISSFLFQIPKEAFVGSDEFFMVYANKTAQAITEKIRGRFPNLSLDNRLAILIPDEQFKDGLRPHLQQCLERMTALGAFELIDAVTASCVINRSRNIKPKKTDKQRIVYDSIGAFDGLERLIVVVVGMDRAHSADSHDGLEVRSQIYRALTRAHMLVCIVNEHVKGGWMEFLGVVSFDSKCDLQAEAKRIDNRAAGQAVKNCNSKECEKKTPVVGHDARTSKDVAPRTTSAMVSRNDVTGELYEEIQDLGRKTKQSIVVPSQPALDVVLKSCVWDTYMEKEEKGVRPGSLILAFRPLQNSVSELGLKARGLEEIGGMDELQAISEEVGNTD